MIEPPFAPTPDPVQLPPEGFEPLSTVAPGPDVLPESSADLSIADASLAQVLGLLLRYPRRTAAELSQAFDLASSDERFTTADTFPDATRVEVDQPLRGSAVMAARVPRRDPTRPVTTRRPEARTFDSLVSARGISSGGAAALLLNLNNANSAAVESGPAFSVDGAAVRPLLTLIGGGLLTVLGVLYGLRNGPSRLPSDLFPLAALLILAGVVIFAVTAWRAFPATRLAPLARFTPMAVPDRAWSLRAWVRRHWLRLVLSGFGIVFMAGAWVLNGDNQFTLPGVMCWAFSVLSWVAVFAPDIVPRAFILRFLVRIIRLPGQIVAFRLSWTLIALLVIMLVGGYFRFYNLAGIPAEMTSDHVEKILDSYNIARGATPVFLPNNGGREVVQFYTLALMHNVLGLTFDHTLLKLLTALEGMLGILAVYWLGRALVGDSDRELGNLTGLVMAALLAISYWQLMLSRLGLRIVLTPFIMTIILIYFVRALRYNRIEDYVKTGLLLGIGLYMYQAVRMVPIVLIVGLLLALLLRARGWRLWASYSGHFAALVIVAAAVFVPLGHYWQQYPDAFWSRTSGRLFGEDLIQTTDPLTGKVSAHIATTQDHIDAFRNNIGYFGQNMVNSVLMFTWAGDRAWISGEQNGAPELDVITGALFLLGFGFWLVRMIRRRDPGDWLVPFGLLVMLFPTALSLAFTIEVPSATRASGTIPMTYLLAGFAGALLLQQGWRALRGHVGRALVLAAGVLLLIPAAQSNWWVYFDSSMPQYKLVAQDHREAGQVLRGFEQSTGAPGNAFMISYAYWWDHRAVAIEAGDINWRLNNGIVGNDMLPNLLNAIHANVGTRYEIRPDRQLLFFLNQNDTANLAQLKKWLPAGSIVERMQTDTPAKDFIVLLSPPVGCDWLNQKIGPGASGLCLVTSNPTPVHPIPSPMPIG